MARVVTDYAEITLMKLYEARVSAFKDTVFPGQCKHCKCPVMEGESCKACQVLLDKGLIDP
jgi:predicted metal-binding protein